MSIKILLLISGLLLLSACTTPVNPDFLAMSKKYSEILVQYQIDSIFANIVRSTRDEPLSFLDMPNINGSGNVNQTVNVSANLTGISTNMVNMVGNVQSASPSYNLSWGNSFNFTQSSLDNSAFWRAFLEPIKPEVFPYFLHNYVPSELLFSLIVEEIVVTSPNGSKKKFINNPLLPNYSEFQNEMYKLFSYGLTVEAVVPLKSSLTRQTARNNQDSFSRFGRDREISSMPQAPMLYPPALNQTGDGSSPFYDSRMYGNNLFTQAPTYRVCLGNLKKEVEIKNLYGSEILCSSPYRVKKSLTAIQKAKEPGIYFYQRSAKTMYDFLGQVALAQTREKDPYIVEIRPQVDTFNKNADKPNAYAILIFNKNNPTENDFAKLQLLDGTIFSIPRENSGYSTLTINLLSQFQVLAKSPGSIPASPGILLR